MLHKKCIKRGFVLGERCSTTAAIAADTLTRWITLRPINGSVLHFNSFYANSFMHVYCCGRLCVSVTFVNQAQTFFTEDLPVGRIKCSIHLAVAAPHQGALGQMTW
jgi:hypothetical protein